MSGEGLLVGVNGANQIRVIDPDKLGDVKKRTLRAMLGPC